MSGIVGIASFSRRPDPDLLARLTDSLSFRGPDASSTWLGEHAGLGHTLLRTTWESEGENHAWCPDGRLHITADVRLDSREDLMQELRESGQPIAGEANDAELVARAYAAWGEECVAHLWGDFAFAIWDEARQSLFCARDHFGVKCFYYGLGGGELVVSNTLECIRLYPGISDELNEAAVGDFLLFGQNRDVSSTFYRDIKRLAPAHTLSFSAQGVRVRRYWKLPVDEELRYRRPDDYVEHFRELLDKSVRDRLRAERASVFMSGGLDSPAIAATVCRQMRERSGKADLRAYCAVYDPLVKDEERHYAGLAVRHLDIAIEYVEGSRVRLFGGEPRWPEPVADPLAMVSAELNRSAAAHSRIVFTGWDGDAILTFILPSHLKQLLRRYRFGQAFRDGLAFAVWNRSLPHLGVRTRLREIWHRVTQGNGYPTWLNPEFEQRSDLRGRWREEAEAAKRIIHPRKPEAYRLMTDPVWSEILQGHDPGVTGVLLEPRHPFLDIRLVRYCLSVPPMPWCLRKGLLRKACRGILPAAICQRRKAGLRDPVGALLKQGRTAKMERLPDRMNDFVTRVPGVSDLEGDAEAMWLNLRPWALALWLAGSRSSELTEKP